MLQTLAKQITGENELKIEFRNKPLPTSMGLLPAEKPAIAEVYGVSLLAAFTVVIIYQVEWYGRPISSGFYASFVASGGSRSSYFCSKYLKAIIANLVFAGVLLGLMLAQGLDVFLFWDLVIMCCFIAPLWVFVVT
jgi:hypothetical protein